MEKVKEYERKVKEYERKVKEYENKYLKTITKIEIIYGFILEYNHYSNFKIPPHIIYRMKL